MAPKSKQRPTYYPWLFEDMIIHQRSEVGFPTDFDVVLRCNEPGHERILRLKGGALSFTSGVVTDEKGNSNAPYVGHTGVASNEFDFFAAFGVPEVPALSDFFAADQANEGSRRTSGWDLEARKSYRSTTSPMLKINIQYPSYLQSYKDNLRWEMETPQITYAWRRMGVQLSMTDHLYHNGKKIGVLDAVFEHRPDIRGWKCEYTSIEPGKRKPSIQAMQGASEFFVPVPQGFPMYLAWEDAKDKALEFAISPNELLVEMMDREMRQMGMGQE